jgi:hypothetical protein
MTAWECLWLNLAVRAKERAERGKWNGVTLVDAIAATWDPVQPRRGTR